MMCKTLTCLALLALLGPATADQPAPAGIWQQKSDNHELRLEFADKNTLKITANHGDRGITLTCSYTAKNGTITGKITEVLEHGINLKEKFPVGLEFTFTWTVTDDTATLANIKGEKAPEEMTHMEGKYDRKK